MVWTSGPPVVVPAWPADGVVSVIAGAPVSMVNVAGDELLALPAASVCVNVVV
jgi:hypothetical protein